MLKPWLNLPVMRTIFPLRRFFAVLVAVLSLGACSAVSIPQDGDILVIGDSIMAWNQSSRQAIPDEIANALGREVHSRAVAGAKFDNSSALMSAVGFDIQTQYHGGRWNWIVLNGGANDLGFDDCNCGDCSVVVQRLISDDGRRGEIPAFLDRLQRSAAHILWMGYYASPGTTFKACGDDLLELERRVMLYLDRVPDGYFVDARRFIDPKDSSLFASDNTHPSPESSAILGTALAEVIASVEARSKNR